MFFSLWAKYLQEFCTVCAVKSGSLNHYNIPSIVPVIVIDGLVRGVCGLDGACPKSAAATGCLLDVTGPQSIRASREKALVATFICLENNFKSTQNLPPPPKYPLEEIKS